MQLSCFDNTMCSPHCQTLPRDLVQHIHSVGTRWALAHLTDGPARRMQAGLDAFSWSFAVHSRLTSRRINSSPLPSSYFFCVVEKLTQKEGVFSKLSPFLSESQALRSSFPCHPKQPGRPPLLPMLGCFLDRLGLLTSPITYSRLQTRFLRWRERRTHYKMIKCPYPEGAKLESARGASAS